MDWRLTSVNVILTTFVKQQNQEAITMNEKEVVLCITPSEAQKVCSALDVVSQQFLLNKSDYEAYDAHQYIARKIRMQLNKK